MVVEKCPKCDRMGTGLLPSSTSPKRKACMRCRFIWTKNIFLVNILISKKIAQTFSLKNLDVRNNTILSCE